MTGNSGIRDTRNKPPRQSQPQVAGRLFVQTKKIEGPKRGWVGMSIGVDATAVVKKDGITHIVRARPKPQGGETMDHKSPIKGRNNPGEPMQVTVPDIGTLWNALREIPEKRQSSGREAYLDLETGEVTYTCERHLHPKREWPVSEPCDPNEIENLESVSKAPHRYLPIPALKRPLEEMNIPEGLGSKEHRIQVKNAIEQWLEQAKRDRNIEFTNKAAILDWAVD